MPRVSNRRRSLPLFLAGGILLFAPPSTASEVAERFLARLKQLGHDDLVVAYLERVQQDPLASPEFRTRARFELLSTRVDQALAETNRPRRAAAIASVEAELAGVEPTSVAARRAITDARGKLALAYSDDARREAVSARRGDSQESLAAARAAIEDAQQRLAAAEEAFVAERETLKGVQPGSADGERRRDLGGRLGQVRLVAARLVHELAMTHPEGSDERGALNRDAARRLGELYEKYSKWVVGLYAHLYEGRCYRLLGETQLALGCLESLVDQPAKTPELRQVVTLAHAELAALRIENGQADLASEAATDWLNRLDREERETPQAATLAYYAGLSRLEESNADGANDSRRKQLLKEAKGLLAESAKAPTEVQPDARAAWTRVSRELGVEDLSPKTFDEAYEAGKEALATLNATRQAANGGVDDASDEQLAIAREALKTAVGLADRRTDSVRLNEARYWLAWIHWESGNDVEAAKLAGGVATRSPDDPVAEAAAQLALATLERVRRESSEQRLADAARDRVEQLAVFTIDTWPDGDASRAAGQVLLTLALESGDLNAAERVISTVDESRRPALSLQYALARYEQAIRDEGVDNNDATIGLRSAYETARGGSVPQRLLATASLYLTQSALADGEPAAALRLLDTPDHGAAAASTATWSTAPFRQQATIALIRSIAGTNAKRRVTEALRSLDAVTDSIAPEGERGVLLTLGSRLRSDLGAKAKSTDASATAVRILGEVLDRLQSLGGEADWNTTLWTAQTRLEIGESADDPAASRKQLEAASAAFASLVERSAAEPGFAPSPTAALAARLQLAQCDRRLGRSQEALDAFRALLAERPAMLDVQVAAAETLQQWGAESRSSERIEASITGDYPDAAGKNAVWGWAKIAAVAGRSLAANPKLEATFFEAWLNVAESRYLAGTLASGESRDEQFRRAASTIKALRRQHPELGGGDTAAEFKRLLQRVDPSAGQGG